MSTMNTPIHNLVLMLDTITKRQVAVEEHAKRDSLSDAQWAAASRVWSRQQEALSCAVIAEPPDTFDDVLAVLIELTARHDFIMGQESDATERELRDLHEMTTVAIKACAVRLLALRAADSEPTRSQQDLLTCFAHDVQAWLPKTEGNRHG